MKLKGFMSSMFITYQNGIVEYLNELPQAIVNSTTPKCIYHSVKLYLSVC